MVGLEQRRRGPRRGEGEGGIGFNPFPPPPPPPLSPPPSSERGPSVEALVDPLIKFPS